MTAVILLSSLTNSLSVIHYIYTALVFSTSLFGVLLMTKKISLPLSTLVCHDVFGLGLTIGRVYPTSACKQGKVDVSFDNDLDTVEFTGRVSTTTDEDGVTVVQRYRTLLVSFLDWDSEDEAEEVITPVVVAEADEPEVSELDEIGFDNVEAIEAAADAEDTEAEQVFEFAKVPRGKVFGQWATKLTRPTAAPVVETEDEEEDAGYADFLANEFE